MSRQARSSKRERGLSPFGGSQPLRPTPCRRVTPSQLRAPGRWRGPAKRESRSEESKEREGERQFRERCRGRFWCLPAPPRHAHLLAELAKVAGQQRGRDDDVRLLALVHARRRKHLHGTATAGRARAAGRAAGGREALRDGKGHCDVQGGAGVVGAAGQRWALERCRAPHFGQGRRESARARAALDERTRRQARAHKTAPRAQRGRSITSAQTRLSACVQASATRRRRLCSFFFVCVRRPHTLAPLLLGVCSARRRRVRHQLTRDISMLGAQHAQLPAAGGVRQRCRAPRHAHARQTPSAQHGW